MTAQINGPIDFYPVAAPTPTAGRMRLWFDSVAQQLRLVEGAGAPRGVPVSPLSSIDNALVRFDGLTGALQGSPVSISDAGVISGGANPVLGTDIATKNYVDALVQGLDWQDSVIATQNTPPGSPSPGDRYLVGTSPTGAWVGHANEIAEWNGSAWAYTVPNEGFTLWDETANAQLNFNGTTWVTIGAGGDHGALSGLLDDDHTQYLLVSGARAMTGQLLIVGGSLAAPGLAISGDPNTGIASTVADTLSLVVAGAAAVSIASNGAVLARNAANSVDAFRVQNAAATRTVLRVDTSNNVVFVESGTNLNGFTISPPAGASQSAGIRLNATTPASVEQTIALFYAVADSSVPIIGTARIAAIDTAGASFNDGIVVRTNALTGQGSLVGIGGVTVPAARLDVGNGTSTNAIFIARDNATAVFTISDPATAHIIQVTGGTLGATIQAFNLTATLNATPSGGRTAVNWTILGNGSAAATQYGAQLYFGPGYTGNQSTFGYAITNENLGTGSGNPFGGDPNLSANVSVWGETYGNVAATNIGALFTGAFGATSIGFAGNAGSSVLANNGFRANSANYGVIGAVTLAKNAGSTTERHVGVIGVGLNGDINVGGFFGLTAATPTFTTAALIVDNGAVVGAPITLFRAAGVDVMTVASTSLILGEAYDVLTGTTTGSRFGGTATRKLSFYDATPIVQPAGVADATGGATIDAEARAAVNAVISRLETLGLIATV